MLCMIIFGAFLVIKKKIHGDEERLTSRLLPSLIKKKHGVLWCQQLLSV